jgi:hypothetical protein
MPVSGIVLNPFKRNLRISPVSRIYTTTAIPNYHYYGILIVAYQAVTFLCHYDTIYYYYEMIIHSQMTKMKKNPFFSYTKKTALGIALAALLMTSCKKDDSPDTSLNNSPGPDVNFYALTQDSKLLSINGKNAGSVIATSSITGLQAGETLLGIDFRPATGQLYGIGSTSRVYVINTQTGAARAINATPFTPAVDGAAAAVDFNPTVDRIRFVSASGQNLRLNPETGTVAATDLAINGAAGAQVAAAAYTQNRAGAATTILYDIDVTNDKLYKQDPPNNGTLVEVGTLGFDVDGAGGFDINPDGTTALAALTLKVNGKTALFTIDLATGKATKVGDFNAAITGIAIPTDPVAYAVNAANELLIFNPMNPAPVAKAITGLQAAENILGMDMRPLNGQLFALGSTSRIYAINASSGAATVVGTVPFAPLLSGTDFGVDFNPTVDRIRVISNTGQNLRLNPNDGTTAAVDAALAPGTPVVNAAAYTNNFAGSTVTVLYDIDSQTDKVYRQDPPNNGTLVEVGALGVNADASNGFDIGGTSGTAYALLTVSGVTKIYTINLTTGAATAGATFPQAVKGFTLGLGF